MIAIKTEPGIYFLLRARLRYLPDDALVILLRLRITNHHKFQLASFLIRAKHHIGHALRLTGTLVGFSPVQRPPMLTRPLSCDSLL